MKLNLKKELAAMEQMTVGQLHDRYVEVFGEPVRSRHRQYLIRRIAWRLQANAEGGLSERALRRAEELANDADVRVTPPRGPYVRQSGNQAMYGRYGTPRITGLIRNEGMQVNHKRVERIWKAAGLKVPKKQPRRGRLWLNDGSCVRLRPEHKDHVWAYDFVQAWTHDGRPFRMLTLVDEYTRECLAIDVARRLRSDDVLERLAWLFATRGVPGHLRSDNGPEFTAKVVREWLARVGVKTLFIEPGSPWENGYVESFNGKLSDELLNGEIFYTLKEAKVLIERWRVHSNTVRPHSALGYRPPAPEARMSAPLWAGSAPFAPLTALRPPTACAVNGVGLT